MEFFLELILSFFIINEKGVGWFGFIFSSLLRVLIMAVGVFLIIPLLTLGEGYRQLTGYLIGLLGLGILIVFINFQVISTRNFRAGRQKADSEHEKKPK